MFHLYPFVTGVKSTDNKPTKLEYHAALGIYVEDEEMIAALSEEQLATVNKMFNYLQAPQDELLKCVKDLATSIVLNEDTRVDSLGTDQEHSAPPDKPEDRISKDSAHKRCKDRARPSPKRTSAADDDDEDKFFSDDSVEEESLFVKERARRKHTPRRGLLWHKRALHDHSSDIDEEESSKIPESTSAQTEASRNAGGDECQSSDTEANTSTLRQKTQRAKAQHIEESPKESIRRRASRGRQCHHRWCHVCTTTIYSFAINI